MVVSLLIKIIGQITLRQKNMDIIGVTPLS